jgi:hypothetical protein
MRRSLLAAIAAALLIAPNVVAASASISVNEAGPYAVGQYVTLTVVPGKLKGYEYPVVLEWCGYLPPPNETVKNWIYFRRWDTKGYDYPRSTGPEPVLLTTVGTCTFELWAYVGLNAGHVEHVVAVGPTITVDP